MAGSIPRLYAGGKGPVTNFGGEAYPVVDHTQE